MKSPRNRTKKKKRKEGNGKRRSGKENGGTGIGTVIEANLEAATIEELENVKETAIEIRSATVVIEIVRGNEEESVRRRMRCALGPRHYLGDLVLPLLHLLSQLHLLLCQGEVVHEIELSPSRALCVEPKRITLGRRRKRKRLWSGRKLRRKQGRKKLPIRYFFFCFVFTCFISFVYASLKRISWLSSVSSSLSTLSFVLTFCHAISNWGR